MLRDVVARLFGAASQGGPDVNNENLIRSRTMKSCVTNSCECNHLVDISFVTQVQRVNAHLQLLVNK